MRVIFLFCSAIVISFSAVSCSQQKKLINDSHLNSLFEQIEMSGEEVGIIHIYSEYPDYNWVGDDDEGIACVDDAARAAVFYFNRFDKLGNNEDLQKGRLLLKFLLKMQSENGFFYNFIFDDYSINKTHKNSIDRPGWWSWRAFWAIERGSSYFADDQQFSVRISNSQYLIVKAIKTYLQNSGPPITEEGFTFPQTLPYGSAADQAALLVLSMILYHRNFEDDSIVPIIKKLSDGIIHQQIDDESNPYYGAFLSWKNTWHAWGNLQSYALLRAYELTGKKEYLDSGLREVDNFYAKLIDEGYCASISFKKVENQIAVTSTNKFSQIAYNIRPMVYALSEAFNITKDKKYLENLLLSAEWLAGKNLSGTVMYNPKTGRCFDGISGEKIVNKNSGAESTIEALLILQKISELGLEDDFWGSLNDE